MADANGDATVNGNDQVLRVWEGLTGNTSVVASATAVSFDRLGALTGGGGAATWALSIPGCTGMQQRTITVSNTGRVSVNRTACP